jgi:hypothetical protein
VEPVVGIKTPLLQAQLPDVTLRAGTSVVARVLSRGESHGVLVIAGVPLSATLPEEIGKTGETLRLAVSAIVNAGASDVRTAVGFRTGPYEPDFHALATESTIVLPWDREVLIDGELVVNPLYEEALRAET